MNAIAPVCVWPVEATLGEGPVWHARESAVYFVDIKQCKLHRFVPASGATQTWDAPAQPGFVVPYRDDRTGGDAFLCGLQGGLYRFAAGTGQFELLTPVESDRRGNRLNDGYVDAQGRLWFGSMDDAENDATGALYSVGDDGEIALRDSGYVITNGPAMSPDARTLYHNDTMNGVVYAFDVASDGTLHDKRRFAQIDGGGHPDGMAVDSHGFVWIAIFGGARIERYAPDGTLASQVRFPCSNVTKLAFGGDDLCTVYATTARKGLSDRQLRGEPLAGGIFAYRAPVPGQPQSVCTAAFR
jgi:sugar lactone lactonase YvrE